MHQINRSGIFRKILSCFYNNSRGFNITFIGKILSYFTTKQNCSFQWWSLLQNISGFDPEMYQMVTAKVGICLPSTCAQDDIDSIVHRCKYNYTISIHFSSKTFYQIKKSFKNVRTRIGNSCIKLFR